MPNELVARNGLIALKDSTVSGSLFVTGSVGVGITPSYPLHIRLNTDSITKSTLLYQEVYSNASGYTDYFKFEVGANSSRGGRIIFGETGGGFSDSYLEFALNATNIYQSGNNPITFTTNNIEGLRVTGDSNVGIGIIAPTSKLQVSGSSDVVNFRGSGSVTNSSIFTVDGAAGRLFSVNDSLSGSLFSVNTISGLPVVEAFSDNTVRVGQYGQKALFVSQSNVGIGKESALNGILDVSGSVTITGSLLAPTITGSLFGTASFAVSASWAPGGGGGGASFPYTGSAIITGSLIVTGSTQITGSLTVIGTITGTSVVETSALRYKQNIQDLESTDDIYKLRPVTFDWKSTLKNDIGFIAEEINNIIPELAEINANGEVEGVKYSKLTVLLTKALQEQDQRLKDQQLQINELKQEINYLKNK
jgi:hypothetical protein